MNSRKLQLFALAQPLSSKASAINPVVLVTGVSSGIGTALALALMRGPYRVVATCREKSREKAIAAGIVPGENLLLLPLDVTIPAQIEAAVEQTLSRFGRIDVLVNNAGISYRAVVEHWSAQAELLQMRTNFGGPFQLIQAVLPTMRKQRSGKIINISSVGGMMSMPTMGLYSASKFALEGASEALWYELRPWGINVSLVQPGFINSNSFERVYWTDAAKLSRDGNDCYSVYYREMETFIRKLMQRTWVTPAHVASVVIETIERKNPPLRVPVSLDGRLFGVLRRFIPRRIYHALLFRRLPAVEQWGPKND